MLISFSCQNFRSFNEEKTLNMTAASISEFKENVFPAAGQKLLKSVAIYGANASGKSNLLSAMGRMRAIVMDSSSEGRAKKPLPIECFQLSNSTADQPSKFEVCFIAQGTQYRYGFEATKERIELEWLFQCNTTKDVLLFFREKDKFELLKDFESAKKLKTFTRPNALFLSVCAQFNIRLAITIQEWFEQFNIILGENDRHYRRYTKELMAKGGKNKQVVIDLMKQADLGIKDINLEHKDADLGDMPKNWSKSLEKLFIKFHEEDIYYSKHNIYDDQGVICGDKIVNFDEWESAGTNKFFNLLGVVVECLMEGGILVIDELDAKLHPLLISQVITLFNSKVTNSKNAQLIFTTHNTHLLSLDLFRRDQIWFTEKDNREATDLYSLVEYKENDKKVRKDASYEKDYIRGRYGAIPFLGDFESLWSDKDGK